MAPVKFGLFKTRSREHQEQPSTENLLQNSASSEQVTPGSPIPSTSKGTMEDLHSPDISVLQLDSDDEDIASERQFSPRRESFGNTIEDPLINYHNLTNQSSMEYQHDDTLPIDNDDASTSCDANSIQFDETSIAPSEDLSVYCLKKKKNGRKVKEFRQLRDMDMWRASDVEVMQNLLSRSSNHDDQIKWEAIATARGLCTLTDNCTCVDCTRAKYLAGVADGDGGLGTAPLFSAINVGCSIHYKVVLRPDHGNKTCKQEGRAIMFTTPPRTVVRTRSKVKKEALAKLLENIGDQPTDAQSEEVMVKMDPVVLQQRPHTMGSKRMSASSSVFLARKKQLELEAAEAKAKIDKELIDIKLAADLAALDQQSHKSDRTYGSESSGKRKVEKWLECSQRELEVFDQQGSCRADRPPPPPSSAPVPQHTWRPAGQPAYGAAEDNRPPPPPSSAPAPQLAWRAAGQPAYGAAEADRPPPPPSAAPVPQLTWRPAGQPAYGAAEDNRPPPPPSSAPAPQLTWQAAGQPAYGAAEADRPPPPPSAAPVPQLTWRPAGQPAYGAAEDNRPPPPPSSAPVPQLTWQAAGQPVYGAAEADRPPPPSSSAPVPQFTWRAAGQPVYGAAEADRPPPPPSSAPAPQLAWQAAGQPAYDGAEQGAIRADRPPPPPPPTLHWMPPPSPPAPAPQFAQQATDIEKLANALNEVIMASTSRTHNPELLTRLATSRDLPLYFGDPLEWLQFKEAYVESTTLCNFSDVENVHRLRKCLRSEAKEAVASMLIGKTSPDVIIQTLELRFGRPELIVNNIVKQIKKLQPLSQAYHNEIVNFATKIKNFAVAARAIDQADYLRSPELITSVVAKFPSGLINRWTDYAFEHLSDREKSKFEVLSDFLITEATKTASAGVSHIYVSQADKGRKQFEERRGPQYSVLLSVNDEKCKFCRTSSHRLPDCPRFRRAMRRDRWRYVRANKLCYKCLVAKHDKQICSASVCDVDNCGQDHHKLLHWLPKKDNNCANEDCANNVNNIDNAHSCDNETADASGSTDNEVDTCEYANNTNTRKSKVLLKVVAVTVHGPNGSVSTHALLDDAATVSLLSANVADTVGLRGYSETLQVRGAWNNTELSCKTEIVNFTITNSTGDSFDVRARKLSDLNLPVQRLSSVNFKIHKYLQDFKDVVLRDDVKPQLLIGQDHYHLLVPTVTVHGSHDKPYVTRTPLGWCAHGVVRCALAGGRPQNDAALLSARAPPPVYAATLPPAPRSASDAPPPPTAALSTASDQLLSHSAMTLTHTTLEEFNTTEMQTVACFYNTASQHSNEDETLINLNWMVRHSFALESIGVTTKMRRNKDELRAISILDSTAKLVDGQWEVGLPWKCEAEMPDSYPNAFKRLLSVEKKMKQNDEYSARYRERIHHLFTEGYAREVKTEEPATRVWYLPHFGIDNPNKKKLRVVYDCAAISCGNSLNDYLLQGPDLLQSLLGIMFRFREGSIGVVGDIKDMFLRIKIRKEDQDALRFLWREKASESVKKYAMTALIFGANCSPFVAQYVKNKNAQRFESVMPEAVNAIIKSHYMDDYIDSYNHEQDAVKTVTDVLKIHKDGGLEMRNLMCNKPEILSGMPNEILSQNAIKFKIECENMTGRTLGLLWSPAYDMLGFDLSLKRIPNDILTFKQKPSKRELLRIVMSIFDVYGLLAPFTIKGRIMIQETWKLNINWNDVIPDQLFTMFREWILQLQQIKDLKIPRWYFRTTVSNRPLELHMFCDAAPSAFSCVAYWRVVNNDNSVHVSFIASKSRVAPVKPVSVPRLELQAALLGCRLATVIEEEHRIKPTTRYFWTDSTTVLHWIRNENRNYKVFIANRLGEIDTLSKISEWRYIATNMNIADIATKNNSYKLEAESEWFRGPSFLYSNSEDWPAASEKEKEINESALEKVLTICVAYPVELPVPDPLRFSSWLRLLGATAVVLKFINRCRRLPEKSRYEVMKQAEHLVIRQAQLDSFGKEINALKSFKNIERSSKLLKLSPMLDPHALLRAGGRIGAATEIPSDVKQPIILDGHHHVSRLIARHYHVKAAHGFEETVVNEIKQKYWLTRLRPTVKYITAKCMLCRLRRARPQIPRMGDLPAARLAHHQRPFTHCGVDLFGPMEATVGRRREKRYGVLFTCLTVRAVHIEIVGSLTTDSLIMALRRMAARRGWPSCLYSDNGTNLRGADVELKRAIHELDEETLNSVGATYGTNWTFIPPVSPHWGGAWERLIRSAKTALKVVLKERAPRDETLATLMAEVEGMMNSRPLTHVTVEPGSNEAITPNHFLLGSSSSLPVPGVFNNSDWHLRKQWRISQHLADMYWRRWVKEVLPEMIPRKKWHQDHTPLKVGDMVLVVDPDGPRNVWPRGIIQEIFPGNDGRVRVVSVKTKTGTLKRPAARVALIPMANECC